MRPPPCSIGRCAMKNLARESSIAPSHIGGRSLALALLVLHFLASSAFSADQENTLHGEMSFWDEVSICVIATALLAAVLIQRTKRRAAEKRFRDVVESSFTGMLLVRRDGRIVLANIQVQRVFGYEKDELLGQPVESLFPERARDLHTADRERIFASPEARPMGTGCDLVGKRKDGSEFPLQIGLSPLRTARGMFILASIIDLTERKRAERNLRSSRRELQRLTRRLLEAQEAERRRIARELHDDLNQSLALLSVEIELLARKPPESADDFLTQMQELNARVKDLSSTVHDLSHQLHPSKLEHLGLVAAVQGLCHELRQSHELEVKFTHYDLPDAFPEDAALCLYRIVQEALRNVIRHGETRHASVELRATRGAILMRIADDGVGFDPAAVMENGGLGLVSMRERLNLIGGRIAIDSRPSHGTRINIRVPLLQSDRATLGFESGADGEKCEAGASFSEDCL